MLGSGAFGKVVMAVDRERGRQVACKTVDLRKLRRKMQKLVENEQQQQQQQQEISGFFSRKKNRSSWPVVEMDKDTGKAKILSVDAKEEKKKNLRRSVSAIVREKLKVYDREARVLEQLCHPNIIGLEAVIKSRNTMYVEMRESASYV